MKRAAVAAIISSLVIVSTAINLTFSIRAGSLARPPIYDDAVYLLDAYQRLAFDGVNTLSSLAVSFLGNPPHAPMSTLTAMLGYSLFGSHTWSPYAANIWLLGLFAGSVYFVARQTADQVSCLLLVAFMLCSPASHVIITEFRPDMGAGVIFALALFMLTITDYQRTPQLCILLLGFLVAAAVMAKPSAVIATVPILGIAAIAGIFRPGFQPFSTGLLSLRSAMPGIIVFIITIAIFAVIWGPATYAYIYQALVTNDDMWRADGGRLFHWTFYSFGPGGWAGLSWYLYLGLATIAIDIAVLLRSPTSWLDRQAFDALLLYLIVVLLYCGMATASQKTTYQGSLFFFPFLLATTLSLSRLLTRLTVMKLEWLSRTAQAALVLLAVSTLPVSTFYQDDPGYRNSAPVLASAADAIAKEASRNSCNRSNFIFAAMNPYPVTVEAIALSLAMTHNLQIKPMTWLYGVRSAEEMLLATDKADFVMLSKGDQIANLPGTKFTAQTKERLSSNINWHLIASTAEYEIYAKKACGLSSSWFGDQRPSA